eukprot:TRINITY_DN8053_c0_g1_i1.p1 TRINITY_DN8053_c0_g1~~TRINITY_DN8053_c0_g1_i1.p1  ORF type:complete len:1502 (-),score=261.44 TRINITY_DN8053_c0_g1_i1:71-4576(-)
MAEVGSLVVVSQAFDEFTIQQGYLVLSVGSRVRVEHVGQGAEAGWLFGQELGSSIRGWFPDWAVQQPCPPELPSPTPPHPEFGEALPLEQPSPPAPGLYNSPDAELPEQAQLPPPGFCDGRASSRHAMPFHSLRQAVSRGLEAGKALPMAGQTEVLLQLVEHKRVVIVDAATGSGKSTLVPLCLASQCLERDHACRIIVTQPRRLAAKGLAKRVADQTETQVGEVIGYRVGGNERVDNNSLVVYVTVGHLLQALVHNPGHLDCYSHLVLDEVHERFVEADFLMALLRLSLSRPETMGQRIVIMSATLQQALAQFFRPVLLPAPDEAEVGNISLPGCTPFKVEDFDWEDVQSRWPNVFERFGHKDPFKPTLPSNASSVDQRKSSDELTKLCKDLASCCAKLVCELHFRESTHVVLVFLPGLDQMKEVQLRLEEETSARRVDMPMIFLMHSALEEETYRDALEPTEPGTWKVVLGTNIAESSLTVPGVSAVIDFGLHRVNVYNDDRKMSELITTWCSRASLKQRRGRTGRTNPGKCIRFMSKQLLRELSDFDASGVERAPLTRVVLEAAYLADHLSFPAQVRAGLPVAMSISETMQTGVVDFWDCQQRSWHVSTGGDKRVRVTLPESELRPIRLSVGDVLGMLPTPPKEDRSRSAVVDLQELGLMTLAGQRPTALGVACLKLPADPQLARLVMLGWIIGCGVDALVLAAALSLSPSCDVFRTPWNPKSELDVGSIRTLRAVIEHRHHFDNDLFSEPLAIHKLCMQWLSHGGGKLGSGPARTAYWAREVNLRLWTQFTEKVIELAQSLLRLVPTTSDQAHHLLQLLWTAQGKRCGGSGEHPLQKVSDRHLLALLTWALAPLGFVAVGQTPALYGGDGVYSALKQAISQKGGQVSSALFWPDMEAESARHAATTGMCSVAWTESTCKGERTGTYVGVHAPDSRNNDRKQRVQMPKDAQLLYRICGPFRGKRITVVDARGSSEIIKQPPLHPCTLNWYMPFRNGQDLEEVFVGWKAQAETLLHIPKPGDKFAYCRPKEFLVAAGGEWLRSGNRMKVILRGVSLLPCEDGGRSGLLWLLAAGMPREPKMVALVAPAKTLLSPDFEVRALRLWRRTFCLPKASPITYQDLLAVNTFRQALLDLQKRKPHRLAGAWQGAQGQRYHIECLEDECSERDGSFSMHAGHNGMHGTEQLLFSMDGSSSSVLMRGAAGDKEWYAEAGDFSGTVLTCQEHPDGQLSWTDGSVWTRPEEIGDEISALQFLSPAMIYSIKHAASSLLSITSGETGMPSTGHQSCWPARLVGLEPSEASLPSSLAPFDLEAIEEKIRRFSEKLAPSDKLDYFPSEHDVLEEAESNDGEEDEDSAFMDTSHEQVNEDYMWRLAKEQDFEPKDSKYLAMVESTLALPTSAICAECEQEGKAFSKRQLADRWDHRVCEDCVKQRQRHASKPANGVGSALPDPIVAGPGSCQAAVCSLCKVQLTRSNCTPSQKSKAPSRRKCMLCVAPAGQG